MGGKALLGLRTLGNRVSNELPSLYISALATEGLMVATMCQRFIQERNESGLCSGSGASKRMDSESFDSSIDGSGELDIVIPPADTRDEGDDGGDDSGLSSSSTRGREKQP